MYLPKKNTSSSSNIKELISYTYPRLYTGKEWYIGFYAFDPLTGGMRRKKIKINYIAKITDRRRFADGLIKRLCQQLDRGWNPWIEKENAKSYVTFKDVCEKYRIFLLRMFDDGEYREETYVSYISYLKNIEEWNDKQKIGITYIYQFDSDFIAKFLEHIYIERRNSIVTRNNYLSFMRSLSTWLIEGSYMKTKPTDGIKAIKRRSKKKNRIVLENKDLERLKVFLEERNKHYLLACYILHYCFIRPKEMGFLQIQDFSLKNQTIFISGEFSKNRKDAVVTLPAKVANLMIDLNIFNYPGDFYLFSNKFMPGAIKKAEKRFGDYWVNVVRKKLKFPPEYKFYSLKDTGITNMLRSCDSVTVRDQARHADILMTDIYTPHDLQKANDLIKNFTGNF